MQKGLLCSYKVFAALPHLEKEYDDKSWMQRTEAVMKAC